MKKKEEMLRLAGINEQVDYPFNYGYMIGSAKRAMRELGNALQMSEIYSGRGQHEKALGILAKAIREVMAELGEDIKRRPEDT